MPAVQSRLVIRLFATFVWFSVLAGQFWRNLGGWWGFGAVAVLVVVGSVIGLSAQRAAARDSPARAAASVNAFAGAPVATRFAPAASTAPTSTASDRVARGRTDTAARPSALNWRKFPKTVTAFLLLAILSIAWSQYPGASALGITLQLITTLAALFLAATLTWPELLRSLAGALRWVLALSLVFELFVAVVVQHAVLPFFVDYGTSDVPNAFYWSRGRMLTGGPIEGIVANRNLLGFVALLAIIVFTVQLRAHSVKRNVGLLWLTVAVGTLLLTRSATVTVSLVAVVAALVFALWARRVHDQHRRPLYAVAAASVLAVAAALALFSSQLFGLLGRSDDLTGRFDIWSSVIRLALERPVFGWGWVSYWVPWVEPFNDLAVRKGVTYLQAHNAWLDVWLQLGVVGVILFAALVGSTLWRAWFLAVDRPRLGVKDTEPFAVSALLPLLLLAALIAQSIAESRLLIESGWVILITLAVVTKRQQHAPRPMP